MMMNRGSVELRVIDFAIEPAEFHQGIVVASLDDVAVLHDEDEVSVFDGGQPVGDDEAGPAGGQGVHGLLDEDFGPGIDVAGRFVEDEHRRVLGHGAGNGNQLLLSGGEGAFLLDFGVQSLRKRLNVVAEVGFLEDFLEAILIDVLQVVDDVLAQGAVDDPGLLQNHAEDVAELVGGHILDGDAVDEDVAAGDFVEAHEEVDQGGLAGAGRTDDGDLHARLDLAREVLDGELLGIIAEANVPEFDFAADVVMVEQLLLFAFFGKFFELEEAEDPVAGGGAKLDGGAGLTDLGKRLLEEGDVNDEAGDDTDFGDGSIMEEESGGDQDRGIGQEGDEGHGRFDETADGLGLVEDYAEDTVLLLEFADLAGFGVEGLDNELAGVVLFDRRVDFAEDLLALVEQGKGELEGEGDDDEHDRKRAQDDQGHLPAGDEHGEEDAHEHDRGLDEHAHGVLQRGAQRIHVVGNDGEDVAGLRGIEVIQGQFVDFCGDLRP